MKKHERVCQSKQQKDCLDGQANTFERIKQCFGIYTFYFFV